MKSEKKKCFIITSIGEKGSEERKHSDYVYDELLSRILDDKGYYSYRAHEIHRSGRILDQVIKELGDADLVIADLTRNNPNVFYELGFRNLINKPVIHIKSKGFDLPFDLQHFRTIEYDPDDLKSMYNEAYTELAHNIDAIEQEEKDEIENPISETTRRKLLGNIENIAISASADQSSENKIYREAECYRWVYSQINKILDSTSAWITPERKDNNYENAQWRLVEFRNAFGMYNQVWIDPHERREHHADKKNKEDQPGHKRVQLTLEERAQFKIEWPGIVYRVAPYVCVASRPIQEFAMLIFYIARCLHEGVLSENSAGSLWRPLDTAFPKHLSADDNGRPTDYAHGEFWRWIEFFVFGNFAEDGLLFENSEKLEPWKKLHKVITSNAYRIDHKDYKRKRY